MTIEDIEHRVERIEAQHLDYISVLSSHTAAMAALSGQMVTLQESMSALQQVTRTLVAEMATFRQETREEIGRIGQRLELLEAFLRKRLNGGSGED